MTNEKFDEKEMEKREEKSADEKSWEEKYRRDPVGTIVWALILIWAGLVQLAENLGYLDAVTRTEVNLPGIGQPLRVEIWSVIVLGAGVIVLLGVLLRLLVPEYRRPVGGSLVFAVILIALGLGDLVSWNLLWPLILIALGLSMVLRGAFRSR